MRKKKPGPKPKKYCKRGHLLVAGTVKTNSSGSRFCYKCKKEKEKRWRESRQKINERKLFLRCRRILRLIHFNPKILMQPYFYGAEFYRASELREIDIGSCYLAEIRAAQNRTVIKATVANNDQADFGRRLSA